MPLVTNYHRGNQKTAIADIADKMRYATATKVDRWRIVDQILDNLLSEDYSVLAFNTDIMRAFPEFSLYSSTGGTSSGRGAEGELERTRGAFFAIFWFLRMHKDGRQGFCFGVDADGQALTPDTDDESLSPSESATSVSWIAPHSEPVQSCCTATKSFITMTDSEKRSNCFNLMPWVSVRHLFIQAKILLPDFTLNRSRLRALLVLTAIHDICKMESLLPTVDCVDHFHGYRRGEVIRDHDAALSYILTHYPEVLPSFHHGLTLESQRMVLFTQSIVNFNHGWFVQAEAPPGPLFQSFRELLRNHDVLDGDLAFYFVHWLTDLAGDEPTPLRGSEKFVLKFPHQCMFKFIHSFSFVSRLSNKTETEVYEEYLRHTWRELQLEDSLFHDVPDNIQSIALYRLLLHGQRNNCYVFQAFALLSAEQRDRLVYGMSNTGIPGEYYSCCPYRHTMGPAIMIYYAPAFLQQHANSVHEAVLCLQVLAEIYHQTRFLLPTVSTSCEESLQDGVEFLTVLADKLKEQYANVIEREDTCWVLVRSSSLEARVELVSKDVLTRSSETQFRVLHFPSEILQ